MGLMQKLLEIQRDVDSFLKDMQVGEGRQAYKAVDSEKVLERIRPLMNEKGLLLFPEVKGARVLVGSTSNGGTTRYFTEMDMCMTWHDVETGEERAFDWYAQGVDLAGEKGVGKAQTYAEKYFLLKFFHIPTKKDDPDEAKRTSRGELRQSGTQAAEEVEVYQRMAVEQMALELCGGDLEKVRQTYVVMTRNEARGYAGTDDLGKLSRAALAIVYGRMKATYKDRLGKEFVFKAEVADDVVEG